MCTVVVRWTAGKPVLVPALRDVLTGRSCSPPVTGRCPPSGLVNRARAARRIRDPLRATLHPRPRLPRRGVTPDVPTSAGAKLESTRDDEAVSVRRTATGPSDGLQANDRYV